LQEYENKDRDLNETQKTIIILKTQLEEATMIDEVVRIQLKEKKENCEKPEDGIISLRKELEKTIDQLSRSLKFGKSIKILDNIIIHQRSPFIKTGLGYNEKKIPLREMQALRSQSHHKRKMKKILKTMLIFSKAPSTMKVATGKEMMTNKNLIILTRTTRMSSEELFHQEGLSQPDTKIYFLSIVFLAIILVIKH
jgi:hypothetical protein